MDTARIWLVVASIYFGLLLATGIVGTVIYDLIAVRNGWRTVSAEVNMLSRTYPVVTVIGVGVLAFAVGCLCGHLFLAQYLPAP